jgi:hypothetical protein
MFGSKYKKKPNIFLITGSTGIGIIGFFINLFEIIAISILLYLNME